MTALAVFSSQDFLDQLHKDPAFSGWETSGIQDAVDSFQSGLGRCAQMPLLLFWMYSHGQEMQFCTDSVRLQCTGTIFGPPITETFLTRDSPERSQEYGISKQIREERQTAIFGHPRRPQGGLTFDTAWEKAGMVACWSEQMHINSLHAFYESLVISAWTTFEIVSEDLWECAVNARPTKLGSGNIPFNELRVYDFNIAGRVGTVMKRDKNRSFRTLWDIRDEYRGTFSVQNAAMMETLNDPALRYSAAVRNVLIHKGGKIDKEYQEQVNGVPDAYMGTIGEKFPLTGKAARKRADAAFDATAKLLKSVHVWLVGHPV